MSLLSTLRAKLLPTLGTINITFQIVWSYHRVITLLIWTPNESPCRRSKQSQSEIQVLVPQLLVIRYLILGLVFLVPYQLLLYQQCLDMSPAQ